MQLTVDACIAAVEDAGPTLADIDGLTTYPAASQARPGFSGASLRDIHDAGVKPNWVAGGVESPGQLGAVVDAMLAVAGGVADHVLCWRSIYEGTAQGAGRRKGYGASGGRPTGMMAWQLPFGATAANLAGMQIRARLIRYELTGQLSSSSLSAIRRLRHESRRRHARASSQLLVGCVHVAGVTSPSGGMTRPRPSWLAGCTPVVNRFLRSPRRSASAVRRCTGC